MALRQLVRRRAGRALPSDRCQSAVYCGGRPGSEDALRGTGRGVDRRPDRARGAARRDCRGAQAPVCARLAGVGAWHQPRARCRAAASGARFYFDSYLPRFFRQAPHHAGRSHNTRNLSMIRFETTLGDFTIELFEKEAPESVANFIRYIEDGFFDGTIFHRIVPGFVIQGGGFTEDMTQKKTKPPIKNEADNGLKNKRGTLSMARTNDINNATSPFFVNLKDNYFLHHSSANFCYAVVSRVTEGMDVVDKIAAVETGRKRGFDDVPVEAVAMKSVKRVKS